MKVRRFGLGRGSQVVLLSIIALLLIAVGAASIARSAEIRAAESFRTAAALQNRGLYNLAADEWAALLDAHPQDPLAGQARFYRGVCLFTLERYADSAREFERVLEDATLEPAFREQARANLGLACYNLGRSATGAERDQAFDDALASFTSQLRQFPNGSLAPLAVFYPAEIAYARGELATAVAGYRSFLSAYADNSLYSQALYALGVALQESGQPATAANAFQQFVWQYPDHDRATDAHSRLAESLFAQAQAEQHEGRLAAASGTLGRLLSTYPHHKLAKTARLTRASLRYDLAQYSDAMCDVDALLATRPTHAARSDALLVRGMCQAALKRHDDAVHTFKSLLDDDPNCRSADRVLYELAWAYAATNKPQRALATFRRLAESHPKSALAAECWFRVGESQYTASEFAAATESFESAHRLCTDAELGERAIHKQAWSLFSQKRYGDAERIFAEQLSQFAEGPAAADARIMIAESRYAAGDYSAAFDAYQTAFENDHAGSSEVRRPALLHAAQTANQTDHWAMCLAWLEELEHEFPDNQWTTEIRCERGWALFHQQKLNDAWREFEFVAGARVDALGARARFMQGEIQFARKRYDAAVRTFFKVAYGYGGVDAPPAFRRWQAEALYEAARCLEQTRRIDSARKLYHELLTYYPESARADHARLALNSLRTR
jgi:TolA-binding protein